MATLLALTMVAAACSKQETAGGGGGGEAGKQVEQANKNLEPNDPPKDGGKIIMAVTAETNGWNPMFSQWADAGSFVGSSVVETLLAFDGQGDFIPWLADSVDPKKPGDFTTWVVKLKPNIKFHNGSALDAAVVKRNLEGYAAPGSLSGLALTGVYKDMVVVDPLTLEINLNKPWSAFRANIAGGAGYIMANEQLDAPDQGKGHPIGTGPFVFDSWSEGSSFKARKNPNYWHKGPNGEQEPHIDELEFRVVTDSQARVDALRAGDIDMLLTTRAQDASVLQKDYTVVTDLNSEKTFVMLNILEDPTKTINPFKNLNARKALAYATNREALIHDISPDFELKSSTTPIMGSTKWAMDESQTGYYPYDPAKAREFVEAYKKETGESGIKFQFAGLSNIEDQKIQQILQAQWKEVGIESSIDTREQTSYITQLVLGGFQAAYFRNYAYPDPDSDWVFWHSSQAKGLGLISINFHQMQDAELDAAIDHARTTEDVAQRKADYAKATQRINAQATNIWLFNTPYSVITDKRIRGMNSIRQITFGNFLPKPWFWSAIWKQ